MLCGTGLAYGFLLLLTSASVWFMRNQSLFEMWWLFSTLMRYPQGNISRAPGPVHVGCFFFYVVPIMLVSNVPAEIMMRAIEPELVAYTIGRDTDRVVGKPAVFQICLGSAVVGPSRE